MAAGFWEALPQKVTTPAAKRQREPEVDEAHPVPEHAGGEERRGEEQRARLVVIQVQARPLRRMQRNKMRVLGLTG